MTKLVAIVPFDNRHDAQAAAVALARAGYWVTLMPEELRARLEIPGDDFLQVMRLLGTDKISDEELDKKINAMMHDVNEISGTGADDVGPVDDGFLPFADVFPDLFKERPDLFRT